MANFKLESTTRVDTGKGVARKLRALGDVPGVLYGHKEAAVSLILKSADMRVILHAQPDSAIVDLKVDGKELNAIIRDTQRHPASGKLLHVDFQRISLDEKVRVAIQVELVGIPEGVKTHGGVLEHTTRAVSAMCLPAEIPESIDVDVSDLGVHDQLRLESVMDRYPDLEWLDDPDTQLAAVLPPVLEEVKEEEEDEASEEEAAAGATEEKAPEGEA